MEWLGKNYFKIGILIAVFALPYFLYYLPVVVPKAQLQKNITDCNVKGNSFSQEFKQQSLSANPNIESFVPPVFHFSQQSNSCLSENGYTFPDNGGDGTYMQITNVDTGAQVLRSALTIYEQENPSQGVVTYDDFMIQAQDIMSK